MLLAVGNARLCAVRLAQAYAQLAQSHWVLDVVSGLWASQASGVAVREYGRVVPLGSDGSYMVYERLDYAETKRRAPDAAAAMKRLKSLARGQTWGEQADEEVRARRAWGGGLTEGACQGAQQRVGSLCQGQS